MQLKIQALSGYHDRVEVLLHAAFQVLVDFMEKEEPDKLINWESDAGHSKVWKEMKELYVWYTKRRPNRKDPLDNPKLKCPSLKTKKITNKKKPGHDLYFLLDYNHKKYKAYDKAIKEFQRLEVQWREEDQKNLHRLIDVRGYLWT
jgi:hypothetical protein